MSNRFFFTRLILQRIELEPHNLVKDTKGRQVSICKVLVIVTHSNYKILVIVTHSKYRILVMVTHSLFQRSTDVDDVGSSGL